MSGARGGSFHLYLVAVISICRNFLVLSLDALRFDEIKFLIRFIVIGRKYRALAGGRQRDIMLFNLCGLRVGDLSRFDLSQLD